MITAEPDTVADLIRELAENHEPDQEVFILTGARLRAIKVARRDVSRGGRHVTVLIPED